MLLWRGRGNWSFTWGICSNSWLTGCGYRNDNRCLCHLFSGWDNYLFIWGYRIVRVDVDTFPFDWIKRVPCLDLTGLVIDALLFGVACLLRLRDLGLTIIVGHSEPPIARFVIHPSSAYSITRFKFEFWVLTIHCAPLPEANHLGGCRTDKTGSLVQSSSMMYLWFKALIHCNMKVSLKCW